MMHLSIAWVCLATPAGHLALRCEFAQTDLLGLQLIQEEQPFNVITCMFALHYFFDKEETSKVMLQTIAANLKAGELEPPCRWHCANMS
jgi:hypothetical protein